MIEAAPSVLVTAYIELFQTVRELKKKRMPVGPEDAQLTQLWLAMSNDDRWDLAERIGRVLAPPPRPLEGAR